MTLASRYMAVFIACASVLVSAPPPVTAGAVVDVTRLGGATRTETAAHVATSLHPDGTDHVVVVRSDRFQEALVAAPLAGALQAPILLSADDEMDDVTQEALSELGAERITLVGDETVFSTRYAASIDGVDVTRVEGSSTYGTAAAVADEVVRLTGALPSLEGGRTVLLASGEDFPDALSASGPAFVGRVPLLLTAPESLPAATIEALLALAPEQVILFGGPAAVDEHVADQVAALGPDVLRLAGPTRTATATAAAEHFTATGLLERDAAVLVRGDDFADDLAAAPVAGALGAPILLSADRTWLSDDTVRWAAERCGTLAELVVVGGTTAVPQALVDAFTHASATCAAPDPAEPASFPGDPAPGTVYWGAAVGGNGDPTQRHEQPAGVPLSLRRTFFRWDQRNGYLPRIAAEDLAVGRLPWVSIKTPGWTAMADGTADAEIDELRRTLDGLDGPVWLTVHHEPEGGGGVNHPDDPAGPEGHRAANRRVRERMEALGTDNIALSLILMGWTWDPRSGRDPDEWWEPGLYDFVGIDPYRDEPGGLLTETWADIRRWAAEQGTVVAVGEWGMRGDDEAAAQHVRDWYAAAAGSATDGAGARVIGLAAFDSHLNSRTGSWELPPSQLHAFHALLADPRTARL